MQSGQVWQRDEAARGPGSSPVVALQARGLFAPAGEAVPFLHGPVARANTGSTQQPRSEERSHQPPRVGAGPRPPATPPPIVMARATAISTE